ncbi:MAG: M1 family aminopeptidase [bacterium]|jgi:hypothetical protein
MAFRLFAGFLTLSFGAAAPAWADPGSGTPPHHELLLVLSPEDARLQAVDTLTLPPEDRFPPELSLSLSPNARVSSVFSGGAELPFRHRNGVLSVNTGTAPPGGARVVRIAYEGTFREMPPGNPMNMDDPSFGVAATISPKGIFLGIDAEWYPDLPGGNSTFRVRVEAPAGYEAVTAGTRILRETSGGKSISEWDARHPLRGLSLSAGRYVVRDRFVDNVLLSTYFFPGNDPLAEKYLDAVGRYLKLYRELLGPYPFGKFAVVENFFPTGYGFPSWTLLGSTVIALPFIIDTSLGHEIAHSWWGNGVFVDPKDGNWSEGLTTYVADYLYKENASAAMGREYRLKILRDYTTLVPPGSDFPVERFSGRSDPATQAVGYGKAAMIFHMARREIGDEAFWNGLRNVVRTGMFRSASWTDFARELGAAAGRDMGPFFREWIGKAGAPSLSLSDVREETSGTAWRISGRVKQRPPYYSFKVPLRVETSGKPVDVPVSMDGEFASFTVTTTDRPVALRLDPDVDLFRRLDPREIPPTVNGIRGSDNLAVVVTRGFPPESMEAAKILLSAMGKEHAPLLREEELFPDSLEGHDVLFLGVPSGKGFLPEALPGNISLAQDRFLLEGTAYSAAGDALFAVFPRPADPGRVAAVFLPLSPSAVAAVGRKIPHYGKYSYLVFTDGENRSKGTWEPADSPVVHRFGKN